MGCYSRESLVILNLSWVEVLVFFSNIDCLVCERWNQLNQRLLLPLLCKDNQSIFTIWPQKEVKMPHIIVCQCIYLKFFWDSSNFMLCLSLKVSLSISLNYVTNDGHVSLALIGILRKLGEYGLAVVIRNLYLSR